jgi:hypothetical protein
MHRLWATEYRLDVARAIAAAVLFVGVLAAGFGAKSLIVLGAAAFWMLMARSDRRRARQARRHRELRERRRQRMRDGTWTRPYEGHDPLLDHDRELVGHQRPAPLARAEHL